MGLLYYICPYRGALGGYFYSTSTLLLLYAFWVTFKQPGRHLSIGRLLLLYFYSTSTLLLLYYICPYRGALGGYFYSTSTLLLLYHICPYRGALGGYFYSTS